MVRQGNARRSFGEIWWLLLPGTLSSRSPKTKMIFTMTYVEELREKRKSSLIVVCTLGLASLFMEDVCPIWMTNIFEGLSFAQGGMGFVLKLFSFFTLGLLTAAIFFIIHLVKVIYYSVELSRHT